MTQQFAITRKDGRSHQQVVIDAVCNAEPDTFYTYDALEKILDTTDRNKVRQIVINAQHRLLREHKRTMINIRGEGYKLAKANEHMAVATSRKRRADLQMKRGLHVLQNVRWDEMDEQTRLAHQGQLLVMSALWNNQKLTDKRQNAIDEAIRNLTERIDKLEQ